MSFLGDWIRAHREQRVQNANRYYDPHTGGSVIRERHFDRLGLESGRQNPSHQARKERDHVPRGTSRRGDKGSYGDEGHIYDIARSNRVPARDDKGAEYIYGQGDSVRKDLAPGHQRFLSHQPPATRGAEQSAHPYVDTQTPARSTNPYADNPQKPPEPPPWHSPEARPPGATSQGISNEPPPWHSREAKDKSPHKRDDRYGSRGGGIGDTGWLG